MLSRFFPCILFTGRREELCSFRLLSHHLSKVMMKRKWMEFKPPHFSTDHSQFQCWHFDLKFWADERNIYTEAVTMIFFSPNCCEHFVIFQLLYTFRPNCWNWTQRLFRIPILDFLPNFWADECITYTKGWKEGALIFIFSGNMDGNWNRTIMKIPTQYEQPLRPPLKNSMKASALTMLLSAQSFWPGLST